MNLFTRILCAFGLHKWEQWSVWQQGQNLEWVQGRNCEWCNYAQRERLYK